MLYVVALLMGPLAVWLCGRPQRAMLNAGLCLAALALVAAGFVAAWLVPLLDALLVVHDYYADQHLERMVRDLHEAHRSLRDDASSLRIVRFPNSGKGSGGAAA